MRVLLSIKPEYAFKIFDGTKQFEYRRVIFKYPKVQTVVVYASAPVQKVIGEFDISEIISLPIDRLWEYTKESGGVSESLFREYFSDKHTGYAIGIGELHMYNPHLCIKKDFNSVPPQNFKYLQ